MFLVGVGVTARPGPRKPARLPLELRCAVVIRAKRCVCERERVRERERERERGKRESARVVIGRNRQTERVPLGRASLRDRESESR